MMCEDCGERAAAFHLTTINNGEKVEKNLCPQCMANYQKELPGAELGNLAGMLAGIMNAVARKESPEKPAEQFPEAEGLVCDGCGMEYEIFRKSGVMGCAKCYEAFAEPLKTTLQRMHGHDQHVGKAPAGVKGEVSMRLKLDRLKQQMTRAIADEAYEDAAVFRDQIRAIQQQLAYEQNGGVSE